MYAVGGPKSIPVIVTHATGPTAPPTANVELQAPRVPRRPALPCKISKEQANAVFVRQLDGEFAGAPVGGDAGPLVGIILPRKGFSCLGESSMLGAI